MTEPAPQLRSLDLVQVVLERPPTYTSHGSYNEVVAFIEGYHAGHRYTGTQWFEFLSWLREQLGEVEGRVLVRFRQGLQDDTSALQELQALYNAFLERQAEPQKPLVEE
ncbi:hypothetical protein [Deinococcus aquaedulcis]|uniref:hypothetical protein n=1 Tax=Deinococcus aquaedulcis TaxID=2840455 RepID=UPI001C8355AF|nr:hypothetical protein [Deinococcus aquaedulcis]